MKESTCYQRLRAEYRRAFDEWALQVSRLQAFTGPLGNVAQAEARVAAAQAEYRICRDRMTDGMS
ncbi:MAG TPA: hypothetical protein VFV14_05175 [Myxococcaceae bacterium]|nr:hypothetical protein [Myxococcaceae bacterium]